MTEQQAKVINKIFIEPSEVPTQEGAESVRFDFNNGCRVFLPNCKGSDKWKLRLSDIETGNIIFEVETEGGSYRSAKVFYVPFMIECWRGAEKIYEHCYSANGRNVQIQIPVGTLGDSIAWFPYADLFQKKHHCNLTVVVSEAAKSLFESEYPNIQFLTTAEAELKQDEFYATYCMGLFFDDWECTHQPVDFRYVGLHKTAAYILGVDPVELSPKVKIGTDAPKIDQPYVCIAVQSSTQCKYWNNPYGWLQIVSWLKEQGYRVLCIDKDPVWGHGLSWNQIPHGSEDFTGAHSLSDRAQLLQGAEFFVGLSSGLAWLAWAVKTPVVMISGFTHPNNEFFTPYRVFNQHTCNSCWNDPRHIFDHADFHWCPRHKGTDRQFECTRLITVDHVKRTISKIPGFNGAV